MLTSDRPLGAVTRRWEQWTTQMSVSVPAGQEADLDAAAAVVNRHLAAVDVACSRFREDSELAQVNAVQSLAFGQVKRRATAADTEPVSYGVSPLLADYLRAALQVAAATDGVVDPTLGRALREAGYDLHLGSRGFSPATGATGEQAASSSEPARPTTVRVTTRYRDGWRAVRLTHGAAPRVTLPAGVELDLGATAKAKAADDAARLAHEATGAAVLVSLGGDVAAAGTPDGFAWPVEVAEVPTQAGPVVLARDGGLATSTVRLRRWTQAGSPRHHLIDPWTGLPAVGRWRTATVAAASCLVANAASTAVLVRSERGTEWLASLGLAARLVGHDGQVTRVGGWPAEEVVAA
jgi:thiamine biosynthesis lipoprotein